MEPRFHPPQEWIENTFTNARGFTIRYGHVFPAKANALISINLGLSECCEKYFEVMHDLIGKGFAVSIHDWMGQGLSDRYLANPHKRHIGTFQEDVDDYFDLMDHHILPKIEEIYGENFPRILLAHSMGGHLSLHALLRRPDFVKGAFFSAPLTRIRATAFIPDVISIPLLKTLNTYYHRQYMPGGKDWTPRPKTLFTHDPIRDTVFDSWCADNPTLKIGSPTMGWVHEAVESCRDLRHADTSSLTLPLHAILAKRDILVDNRATRHFLDALPNAHHETISHAAHELMMETDTIRNRFFEVFDQFCAHALKTE